MKSKLKNAYSTCMECGGTKMKKGGKWIKGAIRKPGSFTAQAKRAGMSTSSFRDKVLANKEKFSSTTVKRANLAKTLSKMRKGQDGMMSGQREYETIKSGQYKGRTFLKSPISDEERLGRQAELAAMSRARKINPMQRQAMQDSVYTYEQTKNPKIMRSAPPKGGMCSPQDIKNGNCKNKEAIHRKAESGYGSMRKGGLTNASMVSGSTKLPKKGQSFAKRKTTTPRFTLK